MSLKRIIKAQILIEWLKFKLFNEKYGVHETIYHGVKLVNLAREHKKAK